VLARRHHRDAGTSEVDAPLGVDAGGVTGGTVTCYTEGAPANTCSLPVHCCFTNYSAQHDGSCTTAACSYGTITCDGPEDCASGELCCAHAITSSTLGTVGYRLACQAGSCGTLRTDHEMCHPGGACSHGACVSAYGIANDLPRTLDICQ
jgi:hypothetical protein